MTESSAATPATAPPAWWQRRITGPLLAVLQQGLTPHQLALTVAVGTASGLVPLLGTTTLLATFSALRLRLNVAATLLVAQLWTPVQLLLTIPLMQQGARLWGGSGGGPELTLDKLRYLFDQDWVQALQLLWLAILGGLLLWAGLSLALGTVLYFTLRPILNRVMKQPVAPSEAAGAIRKEA